MMILLIILAIIGLLDSLYIFHKKRRNEKLICFIGQDCNEVVRSKYAHIYGVPNEVFGIIFYLLIIGLAGLITLGTVELNGISLLAIVHLAAFFALLMSIFLTAIQAFVLKTWCEYCLVASFANLGIFVFSFLA